MVMSFVKGSRGCWLMCCFFEYLLLVEKLHTKTKKKMIPIETLGLLLFFSVCLQNKLFFLLLFFHHHFSFGCCFLYSVFAVKSRNVNKSY